MRISDWSSDVCSSDLPLPLGLRRLAHAAAPALAAGRGGAGRRREGLESQPHRRRAQSAEPDLPLLHPGGRRGEQLLHEALDRKSVVSGKGVSGRVDLGGRCIIKKKTSKRYKNK